MFLIKEQGMKVREMKHGIMVLSILTTIAFAMGSAVAATGKCTVVKVDGTKMIIECNEPTKGFVQGNQIKIKTDKKNKQGQD